MGKLHAGFNVAVTERRTCGHLPAWLGSLLRNVGTPHWLPIAAASQGVLGPLVPLAAWPLCDTVPVSSPPTPTSPSKGRVASLSH